MKNNQQGILFLRVKIQGLGQDPFNFCTIAAVPSIQFVLRYMPLARFLVVITQASKFRALQMNTSDFPESLSIRIDQSTVRKILVKTVLAGAKTIEIDGADLFDHRITHRDRKQVDTCA